jgi:HSP20 family protein
MNVRKIEGKDRAMINPSGEIYEDGDNVIVKLEMPGVTKDNIEISVEGNNLRILGRRSDRDSETTYLIRERHDGDFIRNFTIDETVSEAKIDAILVNGILTLTLTRKEAEKPRKIEVHVE